MVDFDVDQEKVSSVQNIGSCDGSCENGKKTELISKPIIKAIEAEQKK